MRPYHKRSPMIAQILLTRESRGIDNAVAGKKTTQLCLQGARWQGLTYQRIVGRLDLLVKVVVCQVPDVRAIHLVLG